MAHYFHSSCGDILEWIWRTRQLYVNNFSTVITWLKVDRVRFEVIRFQSRLDITNAWKTWSPYIPKWQYLLKAIYSSENETILKRTHRNFPSKWPDMDMMRSAWPRSMLLWNHGCSLCSFLATVATNFCRCGPRAFSSCDLCEKRKGDQSW